ncbi:uncharacterized protein G2W53_037884 [Senna tora]|uniref:Uncharacterized protein n=1 Tax=Senna tora TaxID=362788 RepID=A0A834SN50_9FABA|nr:uncharacterized protein G2W53_037884 [Senna tora]
MEAGGGSYRFSHFSSVEEEDLGLESQS